MVERQLGWRCWLGIYRFHAACAQLDLLYGAMQERRSNMTNDAGTVSLTVRKISCPDTLMLRGAESLFCRSLQVSARNECRVDGPRVSAATRYLLWHNRFHSVPRKKVTHGAVKLNRQCIITYRRDGAWMAPCLSKAVGVGRRMEGDITLDDVLPQGSS
jgi:hypothetical protein